MIREGSSSSQIHYMSLIGLTQGIGNSSYNPWIKTLKSEERGLFLVHLLLSCANHVSSRNFAMANITFEHISLLASPIGDTMQRIASYFAESFAYRLIRTYLGIHKSLISNQITCVSDKILARKLFYDLLPFLKISYLITNQAILEAIEDEKVVHILDFHSSEPAQWISLLQALILRPQGPPHLKITGINENKEVLNYISTQLNQEAEKLDIPFQFNPILSKIEDIDFESLRIKTGESLVISSVLQLHPLLAFNNEKLGKFLKILNGFSPKLMVVTEQEANNNGDSLMERVMESLNFYAALFDCLELSTTRTSMDRQKVEKMFGEEIKNIIASEGIERYVRYEKLEKWIQRIEMVGFGKMCMSYNGLLLGRRLLNCSGKYHGYDIKEVNGCFMMCWQDRPLYSISAWRS